MKQTRTPHPSPPIVVIPSASFIVRVVDDPEFQPRFRLPREGRPKPETPELWVSSSLPRCELLRLLALGEVTVLKNTRN